MCTAQLVVGDSDRGKVELSVQEQFQVTLGVDN